MHKTSDDSQTLMIGATQHRIAGDFLLSGSRATHNLPVRAVICEQYAKSIRLALESFAAHKELDVANVRSKLTLHELFLYCERHGLELRDTPDFSTENFEVLLVACDEKSDYDSSSRNACYTSDLVWPQLYAAHLIEAIQSILDRAANRHVKPALQGTDRHAPFPAGNLPGARGSAVVMAQPGPAHLRDRYDRAAA